MCARANVFVCVSLCVCVCVCARACASACVDRIAEQCFLLITGNGAVAAADKPKFPMRARMMQHTSTVQGLRRIPACKRTHSMSENTFY